MAATVEIGGRLVGDGQPAFVVAEVGINHNGDPELARQLVEVAAAAGCDAVKFQKRTPELATPRSQWDTPRETPWGEMTYLDYRRRVELPLDVYRDLADRCRQLGIIWFASCWDEPSVDAIATLEPACYKVPSASVTDHDLLRRLAETEAPLLVSTGMSTPDEIDAAVDLVDPERLVLLQTVSTYPADPSELNLRALGWLRDRYGVPVGYSGHEAGLAPTVAAVALGACVVERHVTLDRAMWGTDQAASVEPQGLRRLVRDIRTVERALGDATPDRLRGQRAFLGGGATGGSR